MKIGPAICELCGDEIDPVDEHEIDELASEYFMLDTGTIVHHGCFENSKPSEYSKVIREMNRQPIIRDPNRENEYIVELEECWPYLGGDNEF